MPDFALLFEGQRFALSGQPLSRLFEHRRDFWDISEYAVQSRVRREVFEEFVTFLSTGQPTVVTKANFEAISSLAREFCFDELSRECDRFLVRFLRDRLRVLTERVSILERQVNSATLLEQHEEQMEHLFSKLSDLKTNDSRQKSVTLLGEQIERHEEQMEHLFSELANLKRTVSAANPPDGEAGKFQGLIRSMRAQNVQPPPAIVDLDEYEIDAGLFHDTLAFRSIGHEKATGKKVFIRKWDLIHKTVPAFVRSVAIQSQLQLPGVSKLVGFGYSQGTNPFGLTVEEFASFGTLDDVAKARREGRLPSGLNETTFSKVIVGVALIMSQLNALDILHRDLNGTTVVVNERGEPLLIGFHCARFHAEEDDVVASGPPLFQAPEVIEGKCYSLTSDVFAYAVLLYRIFTPSIVLATGRLVTASSLLLRAIMSGERYVRPPGITDLLWDLITACWRQSADDRPSFAGIAAKMMNSDDYILPGTDIDEYHEYRSRMALESSMGRCVDRAAVLDQLRGFGFDVDSVTGLHPQRSQT
jgi:hypothetical protein